MSLTFSKDVAIADAFMHKGHPPRQSFLRVKKTTKVCSRMRHLRARYSSKFNHDHKIFEQVQP
eukprot:scaffold672_cov126-Cylindrotheca_fusiformis.AAC.62